MADMDEAQEFEMADFPDVSEDLEAAAGGDDSSEERPKDKERKKRRRKNQPKTAEELQEEKARQERDLHENLMNVRKEAAAEAETNRANRRQRRRRAEAAAAAQAQTEAEGQVDPELSSELDDAVREAAAIAEERAGIVDDTSDFLPEGILHDTKVPESIGSRYYFSRLKRGNPEVPTTPTLEAKFINDILEEFGYDWKPNTGGVFFLNVGSTVFNAEFEKTAMAYVRMERGEYPILIYDSTIRNNGKYGFVLTNRYFHFHTRDFFPYKLKLAKMQYLKLIFGDTINDWTTLYFKQKGLRGLIPAFQTLNAERALEVADVVMKEIYHLCPKVELRFEVNGVMPYKRQRSEKEKGLRGILEAILDFLFNRGPSIDIPGRTWTAEYHLAKINQKRKAAGLELISLEDLKAKEAEAKAKAEAEAAAAAEAAAEAAAAEEEADDKKGKKGKKGKGKDKGKGKKDKDKGKKDKKGKKK